MNQGTGHRCRCLAGTGEPYRLLRACPADVTVHGHRDNQAPGLALYADYAHCGLGDKATPTVPLTSWRQNASPWLS